MPVPSDITALSSTAAANFPLGSESPATTDDYLRAHASFIAQLRDGKEPSATAGTTAQYWRGDKTWQDLPAAVRAAIPAADLWAYIPIGSPFPLWTHIVGVTAPPTGNPSYRYIKLTASDAYNTGVLASESVSGSAPLVQATAVISDAGSPINGQTVRLINTERRVVRAGSSGTVEADQSQAHEHELGMGGSYLTQSGASGPIRAGVAPSSIVGFTSTVQLSQGVAASSGGLPRIGSETRGKNIGADYYMRIR